MTPAFAQVAQPDTPSVTDGQLTDALAIYEAEPLSPKGADAAVTIMNYAAHSPKVNVVFFEEATPWIINDASGNPTTELMAAFVVGNVKAQLASGKPGTNSYAGTREVFRIYDLIRRTRPTLVMPDIERFLALDKAGKLQLQLAEVDARNKNEMAVETERPETLPPEQLQRLMDGM